MRGPTGLERDSAAACDRGVADGVGIADGRVDVLDRYSEHLGELLRDRRARAADVHRPLDEADGAVVQHVGDNACHAGVVAAEAHAPAAASHLALGLLKRRGHVVVLPDGMHDLFGAYAPVHHAVGAAVALSRYVEKAKLNRVNVERVGDLIHQGLGAVHHDRRTGSAIGLSARLVGDDVVAVDSYVVDQVWGEDRRRGPCQRRSGERPGFESHPAVRCGDLALVRDTHLHPHKRARRRAGGQEDLCAVHDHLHRVPAQLGQHRCDRLQVRRDLATESAADLQRYHLDLRHRHIEYARNVVSDAEVSLAGAPHGKPTVRRPPRGRVLGLDVSLVDGLGGVLALEDVVGLLEACIEVAKVVDLLGGDVHASGKVRVVRPGVVEGYRVLGHRLLRVSVSWKRLVLDLDQGEDLLRGVRAGSRYGSDCVALVQRFVPRQYVVLRHLSHDGGRPHRVRWREDRRRHHRPRLRVGLSLRGVDALDPRVGVG